MAAEVRLVDLEVIKRYSLAVRQESVPAEELLAALDASRDAVLAALRPPAPSRAQDASKAPKSAKARSSSVRRPRSTKGES